MPSVLVKTRYLLIEGVVKPTYAMVYDLLLTYVLPIAAAALVGWFYVKKQLRINPKPIDSPPGS